MKYYYDIHVELEKTNGYSIGLVSDVKLKDEEAINLASEQNKFDEAWDKDLVDYVENITEEEYNLWYNHK